VNLPISGARNRLLAMLSDPDRDLLTPALEAVALDLRQVLEAPNEPISHAYFVTGMVFSSRRRASTGSPKLSMIGRSGVNSKNISL
jgi:hypothetical protein